MHCVTMFGWFNTNDLFSRWSLSINYIACLVSGAYRKHRSSEERKIMRNFRRRQFASSYPTRILLYAADAAAFFRCRILLLPRSFAAAFFRCCILLPPCLVGSRRSQLSSMGLRGSAVSRSLYLFCNVILVTHVAVVF